MRITWHLHWCYRSCSPGPRVLQSAHAHGALSRRKEVSTHPDTATAGAEASIAMSVLLAVDIGVKTGLALYRPVGRFPTDRSQNFGTAERLPRGAQTVLDTLPPLACLVLEGGGPLADIWIRAAMRRHIPVRQISAEAWRRQ